MPYKYSYYVHHHGSGHIMRAIAIAKGLPNQNITFLGSDLLPYCKLIPDNVNCVHLPIDTAGAEDVHHILDPVSFLHYAPLRVSGLLHRNALIIDFFRRNPETILLIDVSAEVALLARLCGIPTVLIRQNGIRNDIAHRLAYESAQLIIAPLPSFLDSKFDNPAYHKTLYAGGFSRYTHVKHQDQLGNDVAVFLGQGGTNIDLFFIRHLRIYLRREMHLHIIGAIDSDVSIDGVTFHGVLDHPNAVLSSCDVVICNAGHNTIMELVDLNKSIICIPASRPFDEQLQKAYYLSQSGCAITVLEEDIYETDWNDRIEEARKLDKTVFEHVTDVEAVPNIVHHLEKLRKKLVKIPLTPYAYDS